MNFSSSNPNKGMKNIRAKIRSSSSNRESSLNIESGNINFNYSSEIPNQGRESENEISFNISRDEDEINKDIKKFNPMEENTRGRQISQYEFEPTEEDNYLEQENIKIKSEAKELIEKTRRMMESLEAHKLIEKEPMPNNTTNKINLSINEYTEEKPCDSTRIIKIDQTGYNVNSINQRLLEKIKNIKNLEKELKDKNYLIEKLNSKIDKQYDDIKKLNEKLNVKLKKFKIGRKKF